MDFPTQEIPMQEFMGRFSVQLFEKAKSFLDPEYQPGDPKHAHIAARLDSIRMLRQPFPAQRDVIEAGAVHLYDEQGKTIVLSQDMGTGKTLCGSAIAMMAGKPQRTIVVVPPHLVGKWARELEITFPKVIVHKINHAGAIEVLQKAYQENPGAPEVPEFWIIGRVRLRMSYRVQPAVTSKKLDGSIRPKYTCPDCGGFIAMPAEKKEGDADPESVDSMQLASTGEESVEESAFQFATYDWLEKSKRTCQHVYDAKNRRIETGCGSTLWQAQRLHQKTPEETLASALAKLPGIGKTTIMKLMAHSSDDIQAMVRDLSNGDIHPAMGHLLKPSARKKVQAYLDNTGFTVGDGNYAPVEYIKRQMHRGWFDAAIFDELHELKGDNTAQGVAFGILSGCCKKTIGLTGTLVDGYAASLHPLLFRSDPEALLKLGYSADDGARFQREMGVVREIVTEIEEDGLKSARGKKITHRQTRNLPGLHPTVVTHMLLPNSLFLELPDIERSLQEMAAERGHPPIRLLPSYRETFVRCAMQLEQSFQVNQFCQTIIEVMKDQMRLGGGKSLMGPVMSAALYAADGAFRDVVCWPKYHDRPIATLRPVVAEGELLEKEIFMRDLVLREKANNRRVLIYTIYSDKLDLTKRYQDILLREGVDARVLKSSVPTEIREDWVRDATDDGCEVLICNPNLVKTGLDLFAFTTILFMQTGYSTDTVLQASRRSWRIGQTEPVRIYFASYDQTPQMTAMALMAKKIRVSTQAKGNISDNGLSAAVEDEDDGSSTLMAIANQFLDGLRDHSHDAITGAISTLAEDLTDGEFRANSMRDIQHMLAGSKPIDKNQPSINACTSAEDGQSKEEELDILSLVFGAAQMAAPRPAPQKKKPASRPHSRKKDTGFMELDLFS
jgi:Superfamily II DNA/RNA helicases, SNF2 family